MRSDLTSLDVATFRLNPSPTLTVGAAPDART